MTFETVKDYLDIKRIGTPEMALMYIVTRMPTLKEVNNTSFNIDLNIDRANQFYYETDIYKEFTNKIALYAANQLI